MRPVGPDRPAVPRTLVLVLVCLATAGVQANADMPPLVAVDVGHTLRAPGATSARGAREYDLNRALARVIADRLAAAGLRVMLINDDGRIAGLTQRTVAATQAGAGFFLSVHHDSVQPQFLESWAPHGTPRRRSRGRRGFSLFVSRTNPDLASSLRCASRIGEALGQAHFQPSRYHAEAIPGESRSFADEANGVYYYDGLAVLRTASSPAILLEAGVITDPDEEARLRSPRTRAALADAVATGLHACLSGTSDVGSPSTEEPRP